MTQINPNKLAGKKGELIRFVLVGGFCACLQYGMYVVFLRAVGVTAVVATLISYGISFVVNFFLSSFFTFHSQPNSKRGLGFTLSHLVNMGLQTGLVAIFKGFMNHTLALLPALAICVPVNFILVRTVFSSRIFMSKKEREEKEAASSGTATTAITEQA